ncbi:tryptophan aminotransferase-related protein 3 [Selaginella moellendorffii]|nr:tryptophan aminotransferase-related protein 3 [Selaginella moellendorffii]|eukprot:XP_002994169.2 tryptophan aminotransferase-related protein 3 [Selaginella moellendorffii]
MLEMIRRICPKTLVYRPAMAAREMILSAAVCLCSIAAVRLMDLYWDSPSPGPHWMEQESGPALRASCSGHGRVFNDGSDLACECSDCYTGVNCSELQHGCMVDADAGDPTFLEPFWMEHGADAGVFMPSWYRMGYSVKKKGSSPAHKELPLVYVIKELEDSIRELHELVGNAVVKDKYLVIGTGSMQLVAAALNALSDSFPEKPGAVVTRAPCYMIYKLQVDVLSSSKFQWGGDAVAAFEKKAFDPSSVVELLAAPNNPDTSILEPVYKGTNAKIIHDKAYYWPHYTAIAGALDEDVMLFSLSKTTGHAGSRIGWALVRDIEVYKKMFMYIAVSTIGVSRESQLRAHRLIKSLLDGYQNGGSHKARMFDFGYHTLQSRWQTLAEIFKASTRFSIQKTDSQHCSFFKKEVSPSPAYAWIRCEQEEDCHSIFAAAGINGRPGRAFGVSNRYIRLCMIKRDDEFELLAGKLQALVDTELTNE